MLVVGIVTNFCFYFPYSKNMLEMVSLQAHVTFFVRIKVMLPKRVGNCIYCVFVVQICCCGMVLVKMCFRSIWSMDIFDFQ